MWAARELSMTGRQIRADSVKDRRWLALKFIVVY